MRVIIAGGRDFGNRSTPQGTTDHSWQFECAARVVAVMGDLFGGCYHTASDWSGMVVLTGLAAGADTLGLQWARVNGVAVEEYPADWDREGRRAGFLRNRKMAQNADVLVAFWDGQSRGTRHMIDIALEHGLTVHVYRYEPKANADEETF